MEVTAAIRVRVVHKPSSYSFAFHYQGRSSDPRPGAELRRHSVKFSPGEGVHDEAHHNLDWEGALWHFDRWLRCLRAETDAPDLLDQAEGQRRRLSEARDSLGSEAPFTSSEQDILRNELEGLKEELAELRIYGDAQLAQIRTRIDDLEGDLGSMQRWKWATLALGMPFRIQALMNLDTDQFTQLWSRIVRLVNDLPDMLPPGG